MTAKEIITYLENWAPPGAAWDRDNVGLQVGSTESKVNKIFLCLDLTEKALDTAIANNCNFIFTHHPLIFYPIYKLDTQNNPKVKLIQKIIKHDITVYSAHTNLDFTKSGVSYELAKTLKLKNIRFLKNLDDTLNKLTVFVPEDSLEKVSDAIFSAGGGVIGEYKKCSYRLKGTGTFEGSDETNPAIGEKEKFETVSEIRFEVLVSSWNLNKVVAAMLKVHPYEEPAFDIYPLKNPNSNFGMGAIGELEKPMNSNEFLAFVCDSLKIDNLRYTNGKKNKIKKVAVCGGSCSELLNEAIAQKADAFVTADVKYHIFQDGENRILFIDAGHYETEIFSLNVVKNMLEKLIKERKENVKILKYKGSTNPVKFFNKKGENQIA